MLQTIGADSAELVQNVKQDRKKIWEARFSDK